MTLKHTSAVEVFFFFYSFFFFVGILNVESGALLVPAALITSKGAYAMMFLSVNSL